jgi:hypothetical protein
VKGKKQGKNMDERMEENDNIKRGEPETEKKKERKI